MAHCNILPSSILQRCPRCKLSPPKPKDILSCGDGEVKSYKPFFEVASYHAFTSSIMPANEVTISNKSSHFRIYCFMNMWDADRYSGLPLGGLYRKGVCETTLPASRALEAGGQKKKLGDSRPSPPRIPVFLSRNKRLLQ